MNSTCIACTQNDDHPKHVIDMGGDVLLRFHHDCHAMSTNCDVCASVVKASGGVTGEELRSFLMTPKKG